jgi:succinyl-diaminopimelate desuccinylase
MVTEGGAAALASALVSIPTRNPPGEERACSHYIRDWLLQAGVEAQLIPRPFPDRPQVLAVVEGQNPGPTLALNGHIDVVPEGDASRWSVPPFSGQIVDGQVCGRGATDMKGGLVAMMLAAEAIIRERRQLKGRLVLQFAIGEETGEPGTLQLLKEGPKPDWGIVLEPSDLQIGIASRGLTWWEIMAYGTASHAGESEGSVNSIELALALLNNLDAYKKELDSRSAHPLLGKPTCSATMVKSGVKENVIPAECRVVLDRRMLPGESISGVEEEIRSLCVSDLGGTFEVRCLQTYEAAEIDEKSPIVGQLKTSIKSVTGSAGRIYGERCSTDARNFINDCGVPTVIWGPGRLDGSHVIDERIDAAVIARTADVLIDVCRGLLG